MPDDRILLGHIAGAHGIRGEVVVKSYTADPADIASYGPLQDEAGARTVEIKVIRVGPKGVVARVKGIADRNGAEALKGTKLYVAREALPEPDDGEFYHSDLAGLAVVAPDGAVVGEVVAIQNFGAGDLLEYRLAGQRRTEFVPFNETYVPAVDLAAGRITVIIPEKTDAGPKPGKPSGT
ncbi:MAG TPA: ribosome maturation factor RimM [Hyphomicrobiaceae bacterium]|nr:ribosome maturation factor RimM [Hyphomicrobiaceae bacterium]